MLKSKLGLPRPTFPQGVDLQIEAQKARHRLYPVTVLYSCYSVAILTLALRSAPSLFIPFAYYALGIASWTYVEYFAHRYILHGRFPDGEGLVRRFLHKSFDHLHYAHHERPWDGNHINGTIKDTLPAAVLFASISFLAPVHTLPVLVAGMLQAYILEEWVHQSVHFYGFRGRYFRYIKRHHLYHHSPQGSEVGFGLTNGLWDVVLRTRIPAAARHRLYRRRRTRLVGRTPPPAAPPPADVGA